MVTNWNKPGSDYPTDEDIQEMEREEQYRSAYYESVECRISRYLRDHPDAS